MQTVKNVLQKSNGSVLIGVVALSALMAIAAAGLIGVSRNTVNQEVESHNDARAYLAAEAGLLAGMNWLKNRPESDVSTGFDMTHDGINVRVRLTSQNAAPNHVRLTSTAESVGADGLPYDKLLEWQVKVVPTTSGSFGYFLDESPNGLFGGGKTTGVFYTKIHFNSPLQLEDNPSDRSQNIARFYDAVTVYNGDPYNWQNIYDPNNKAAGWGANYNAGILLGTARCGSNCGDKTDVFPKIFRENHLGVRATFNATDKKYTVDFTPPPPLEAKTWDILRTSATDATLRTPAADWVLRFGVDNPDGPYFQYGNNAATDPKIYYGETATVIDVSSNAIDTLKVTNGTFGGIVSVRKPSGNIYFDLSNGNNSLLYRGFTGTMITAMKKDSTNELNTKVPKVDLRADINHYLDTSWTDVLAFYADEGNIEFKAPSNNTVALLSAQLFARPGDPAVNGKGRIIVPNGNYDIRVLGVAVSKTWWDPNVGSGGGNSGRFLVLQDQREIGAPGIGFGGVSSGVDTSDDGLIPSLWREVNIPITHRDEWETWGFGNNTL